MQRRVSGSVALLDFVTEWEGQIRRIDIRDVRNSQDAPYASLPFGAAGIGAALGRVAQLRRSSALQASADKWLTSALRARARTAYGVSPDSYALEPNSLFYGRHGVRLIHALHSIGWNSPTQSHRITAFLRGLRTARP